jgi:hypothetical protein
MDTPVAFSRSGLNALGILVLLNSVVWAAGIWGLFRLLG